MNLSFSFRDPRKRIARPLMNSWQSMAPELSLSMTANSRSPRRPRMGKHVRNVFLSTLLPSVDLARPLNVSRSSRISAAVHRFATVRSWNDKCRAVKSLGSEALLPMLSTRVLVDEVKNGSECTCSERCTPTERTGAQSQLSTGHLTRRMWCRARRFASDVTDFAAILHSSREPQETTGALLMFDRSVDMEMRDGG